MAFADLEVVEVMSRGNFDSAGAVSRVGMFVGDDRDFAVGQGEFDVATDEVFVAWVVWVDSDGLVAEDGFGAGGGDDD